MRTGMVALVIGLLALNALPALPSAELRWATVGAGVWCLCTRLWPVGWALLGLAWACTSAQWALVDRLDPALEGRTLWVVGTVEGLPRMGERSVRFDLAGATTRHGTLPSRLQLAWPGGPTVRTGERWRMAVTLQRPSGLLNPHGPDREANLLARRVGGLGSVKAGERLAPGPGHWRAQLRERLLQVDAWGREAVLVALVLGDGSGLMRDDWDVLQATGTVHLMVISGQHIGLLAGLVYGLIAGLARLGLWPARVPWLPWACGLCLLAAVAYGYLAGFQVPVQRACLMLATVMAWRLRFRHLGVWFPLLFAALGVLLLDPLASLLAGFWLSFGAVAVLLWAFAGRLGAWRPWQAWTRAQWVVAVGLLPPLLAFGLPVSLSGPLANLVAGPWLSLVVLPSALLGTATLALPGVGESLLWLAGGAIEALFQVLRTLADWQPAWAPPALPIWAWWAVTLGAVLVVLPQGVPLRLPGAVLLLALWAPRTPVPWGEVQVWQLDVGQGLAVVLQTRHHTLLYDAGPTQGRSDLGQTVVLPTLHKLGVGKLDLMLISHAHADHAGGAASVHQGLPVVRVLGGEVKGLANVLQAEHCTSGERWEWDGVSFSVWRWPAGGSSNDRSCALLVEANGERLLLSGDMERAAEATWLAEVTDTRVDWLQAPHHGSRSSSTEPFLAALGARGALISRGQVNSFGHPHAEVLARYRRHAMAIHDTAVEGALSLRLGRHGTVEGLRAQRRFWRDPLPGSG